MGKPLTLETEILQCRKCADLLQQEFVNPRASSERVEPRPIVPQYRRSQALLLIGQAPGPKEYETRQPFQGQAGQGIRQILAEAGIPDSQFDKIVYSTAVVKCFPGSKMVKGRREDKTPSPLMVANCLPYLRKQFELVRPQVVITLGSFALQHYLKLRGKTRSAATLDKFVGTVDDWDGAAVIFLPHTSGSSRWLNHAPNRELLNKSKRILRSLVEHKLAV